MIIMLYMVTKPLKYSSQFVLQEVQAMISEIQADSSIFYLGQLFDKRDYSMQRFSEWKKDFEDNEEISEAIKRIKELLETRIVVGAMKKELHPTICIFHLKNNYQWTDKAEESQNRPLPIPILWLPHPDKAEKITSA